MARMGSSITDTTFISRRKRILADTAEGVIHGMSAVSTAGKTYLAIIKETMNSENYKRVGGLSISI